MVLLYFTWPIKGYDDADGGNNNEEESTYKSFDDGYIDDVSIEEKTSGLFSSVNFFGKTKQQTSFRSYLTSRDSLSKKKSDGGHSDDKERKEVTSGIFKRKSDRLDDVEEEQDVAEVPGNSKSSLWRIFSRQDINEKSYLNGNVDENQKRKSLFWNLFTSENKSLEESSKLVESSESDVASSQNDTKEKQQRFSFFNLFSRDGDDHDDDGRQTRKSVFGNFFGKDEIEASEKSPKTVATTEAGDDGDKADENKKEQRFSFFNLFTRDDGLDGKENSERKSLLGFITFWGPSSEAEMIQSKKFEVYSYNDIGTESPTTSMEIENSNFEIVSHTKDTIVMEKRTILYTQ